MGQIQTELTVLRLSMEDPDIIALTSLQRKKIMLHLSPNYSHQNISFAIGKHCSFNSVLSL